MLNLKNIQFNPPTNGIYTTVSLKGASNLNNTTSFIFGKHGYIPLEETKQLPVERQTKKLHEKTNLSKYEISKLKSDTKLKRSTLYFYYVFLFLYPTAEITLHSWKKQVSITDEPMRSFICDSIVLDEKEIFSELECYQTVRSENTCIQTVKIDETGFPVVSNESKQKYTPSQSCRYQQHIMIHFINTHLNEKNMKFEYSTKNVNVTHVASIQFDKFIDLDENGNIIEIEKTKENYEKLVDILITFFDYFLNNITGITNKLIIGTKTNEFDTIVISNEYIIIGRKSFLDMIYQMKTTQLSIETIFSTALEKQFCNQQINGF